MTGTLKARVGGEWVRLFNDNSTWNTAWGVVAVGTTTDNLIAFTTIPGTLLTSVLTLQTVANRRYAVKYQARAIASGGVASGYISLWVDGAMQSLSDSWFEGEMNYNGRPFEWWFTGDGLQHSYSLYGAVATGAITLHNQMSGGNCYFYIEDRGPVSTATPAITNPTPAWIDVTFQNGWAHAGGGLWNRVQYRKVGDMVQLRGTCSGGSASMGNVIFNLPLEYRPPAQLSFSTEGNGSFKWYLIKTNGDIEWYIPAADLGQSNPTASFHFNHQFSLTT